MKIIRPHISIGHDEYGCVQVSIEDYELFDCVSDFLCEECDIDIVGNILKENGEESALGEIYKNFEKDYSKFSLFSNAANNIRNELKHSHKNPNLEYEIHIGEDDCAVMLYRALVSYPKAVGQPTETMKHCWRYLENEHANIFK